MTVFRIFAFNGEDSFEQGHQSIGVEEIAKIPFIPLEEELDQLIAALTLMLSVFCQILKETGARAGEAAKLEWTDIDFQRRIININGPEKGSNPRSIVVSEKCIAMINRLPRKGLRLFRSWNALKSSFTTQRKRIAYKLTNPRLLRIHFHTFRHWYATIEQANFHQQSDEFTVKVANTEDEAVKLLEVGFEYVGIVLGCEMFRKQKCNYTLRPRIMHHRCMWHPLSPTCKPCSATLAG